jgi:hypothetical protein
VVSVAKLTHAQEIPSEARPAIEAQSQDIRVASGMASDPASGPNRAPVPTAVDARSRAEETLIAVDVVPSGAVDVVPSGSTPGTNEPSDEALLAALSTAGASQMDPMDVTQAPRPFEDAPLAAGEAAEPRPVGSTPASASAKLAHKKAQGAHASGAIGGLRSRRARRPKREDSIKRAAVPVDIDLGQTGGVDALLYGEGSPGLSHDLSSPPRIGGYVYWECPWPEAAAQAGVNHAVVHVTVDVTVRGNATAVQLIDQPGYEFGDDAIRCAMDQRYIPGRDTQGRPVAGRTRKFSVRFSRRGASGSP